MQQHRSRSVLGFLIGTALATLLPAQGEARLARPTGGFVVNQGQWAAAARYQTRGQGASVWCLDEGWTLALPIQSPPPEVNDGTGVVQPGGDRWVVRLLVEGARPSRVEGVESLPTKTSFCRGAQSEWRRDVPSFERVRWESMLPGVDVEASWRDGRFTYDLFVEPGADPAAVMIRCEGISELRLRADGCLEMQTPHGVVVQSAPQSWSLRPDGVRSRLFRVRAALGGRGGPRPAIPPAGTACTGPALRQRRSLRPAARP